MVWVMYGNVFRWPVWTDFLQRSRTSIRLPIQQIPLAIQKVTVYRYNGMWMYWTVLPGARIIMIQMGSGMAQVLAWYVPHWNFMKIRISLR